MPEPLSKRNTLSTAAMGLDICSWTGKARYGSENAAVNAMKDYEAERDRGQKRHKRAYECKACGGWHLTSRKGRKR